MGFEPPTLVVEPATLTIQKEERKLVITMASYTLQRPSWVAHASHLGQKIRNCLERKRTLHLLEYTTDDQKEGGYVPLEAEYFFEAMVHGEWRCSVISFL